MLVLTRKNDESIIIDGRIEVKILGIEDGKVKLGISAPKEVVIHRKEVYLDIQSVNKEASESNLTLDNLRNLFKK